ncbi:hypothetical protein [Pigmentiphaga daeguensis]|uniref:Uncharacterized protein n=1 Tax=Pigmentiphaga daeguensis TaxID=414049 RepID=A0ABN1B8F5_9BURK
MNAAPHDNQQLRELFTLPPIQASASTALAVPEMPPQETVTGDREVDAVLWLQKVVKTGHQALIDKALEARKRIKTPMKTLAVRYARHVAVKTGSTFAAAFSTFNFGELEDQAKAAIQKAARRHEALSRFGDQENLFSATPAEKACVKALHGLKRRREFGDYPKTEAATRFAKAAALTPTSISDCLHVFAYWNKLYWLRNACVDMGSDSPQQAWAHDDYCFGFLASIPPRDAREALAALEYVLDEGRDDRKEGPAILRNLVLSGWDCAALPTARL